MPAPRDTETHFRTMMLANTLKVLADYHEADPDSMDIALFSRPFNNQLYAKDRSRLACKSIHCVTPISHQSRHVWWSIPVTMSDLLMDVSREAAMRQLPVTDSHRWYQTQPLLVSSNVNSK